MLESIFSDDVAGTSADMRSGLQDSLRAPAISYHVECRDSDGVLKWVEDVHNLVTTAGKTDIVDKYLKGSAYTAAWYLGLINNSGFSALSAADTLSSHAGWTEVTPYSGNRPAITWGTTSAGSNTATAVSFTINATAAVYGAFVCNASSGTTGVLYSEAAFSVVRNVVSGDTLAVTQTLSVS